MSTNSPNIHGKSNICPVSLIPGGTGVKYASNIAIGKADRNSSDQPEAQEFSGDISVCLKTSGEYTCENVNHEAPPSPLCFEDPVSSKKDHENSDLQVRGPPQKVPSVSNEEEPRNCDVQVRAPPQKVPSVSSEEEQRNCDLQVRARPQKVPSVSSEEEQRNCDLHISASAVMPEVYPSILVTPSQLLLLLRCYTIPQIQSFSLPPLLRTCGPKLISALQAAVVPIALRSPAEMQFVTEFRPYGACVCYIRCVATVCLRIECKMKVPKGNEVLALGNYREKIELHSQISDVRVIVASEVSKDGIKKSEYVNRKSLIFLLLKNRTSPQAHQGLTTTTTTALCLSGKNILIGPPRKPTDTRTVPYPLQSTKFSLDSHPDAYSTQPHSEEKFKKKVAAPRESHDEQPDEIFKEATDLLHASDYDKILLIIGKISEDAPSRYYIRAHFVSGVCHFKKHKYSQASDHFQLCEIRAHKERRDGDVMLCNAYLGDIKYASQSYLEATKHYKKAVEHFAAAQVSATFKLTPPSKSAIFAKRASSFRNELRMLEAEQEYRNAIKHAQTDRDRLSAHTSLGNLYQSMGDNSNALVEYKQSIELAERLSDHVSLGWAHGNIGNAYLGLNRKDEAVFHLHKSLDLAVKYEQTPQAIGRTYNNLGTAYQSMNNLDKAEEYYDLALSQAIYGNDIPGQARVYGNIGNVYMLRKNYERAIPHYSEVLRLSSDASTVSTAQHNRGCAYYEWATSLSKHSTYSFRLHGSCNPNCNPDSCLQDTPSKVKELYQKGCGDLEEVVKYHEEKFEHIKGSPRGLTLSVSLFESNSRTFHRLQDCLISLHQWESALVVAERSRARTLGELMLKRKGTLLDEHLSSPLNFEEIASIVKSLKDPLVYFSYTGARIVCWVFIPNSDKPLMNMFEVPVDDDQFDGKSFDYHLRYSLTEALVERSFEMYRSITYDEESSSSVHKLFNLMGKPLLNILKDENAGSNFKKLTIISDSYTTLLPFSCLLDPETGRFLGDHYYCQIFPSLLTMGIMSQLPNITVKIPAGPQNFCIVGDPSIPPFTLKGEKWHLGKLPFARREAEWVAHALQTTPVLEEYATKSSMLNRAMSAKVIHVATHGSAAEGFLAFAHFMKSQRVYTAADTVLLYPNEVENLNISPALVVLSSCDSGRGIVKADGIQGMARAFILAGAQSVLTTLWKVPDESASVFMQFFYQYLVDGLKGSLALHKAVLSVRCFAKYSQYIHWSGYQLTGRDFHFSNMATEFAEIIEKRLGTSSVFPRLHSVKKLETVLIKNSNPPTDVQVSAWYSAFVC